MFGKVCQFQTNMEHGTLNDPCSERGGALSFLTVKDYLTVGYPQFTATGIQFPAPQGTNLGVFPFMEKVFRTHNLDKSDSKVVDFWQSNRKLPSAQFLPILRPAIIKPRTV